jgi:uncharacterized membrane protein YfcA
LPDILSNPAFWLYGSLAMAMYGLSKGGFVGLAVLGLPIFVLALPPLTAAAIMLPVLMLQDAVTVWAYRRTWDRRGFAVLLIGCLIGTAVAAFAAPWLSDAALKLIIGVIALVFALNWWGQRLLRRPEGPPRRLHDGVGVFWGFWCGVTSFIAHAGAPPAQIYLMPMRLAPAVFAGTMGWLFAVLNLVKLWPYLQLGFLTRETFVASLALMPIAVLANLFGIWLVKRIPVARFYPLIYAMLLLVGAKLTYDGLRGLGAI